MRLILLQDVRDVGRKGEVKEVADGFATNFLLPKGLAELATDAKVAELERTQAAREADSLAREEKLMTIIRSLEGTRVEIAARATEKGGLFKSITAADIAKAFTAEGKGEVTEAAILLDAPIKTAGEHPITLTRGPACATATLVITPQV